MASWRPRPGQDKRKEAGMDSRGLAEGSQTARNPKAPRSSAKCVKLATARPVAELGQRERGPRSWAKDDGDVMDVRKVRKDVVTTGYLLSLPE